MRTQNEIRDIAKKINPTVYISFDVLYRDRDGDLNRIIAVKGNEWYSFKVPNLDSPKVEKGLKEVLARFDKEPKN